MKKIADFVWGFLGLRSATFVIIGIGITIRVAVLIVFAQLPLASDALSYHNMALRILANENFSPYWPPALPYFLSFFYYIFGPAEFVGRASMLLFYLIFSYAIFRLTKEITSIQTANITVLLFAIFPTYIFHSVEPYTQLPTATYLVVAAYLIVLSNKKQNLVYSILLGITIALLILTRASSIILLGLIPLYLIFKNRNLRSAVLLFLVALVVVFGWVGKVHQMTGRWIFINEANSANFFFGNNPYTPLYKTWWFGSHGEGDPEVPTAYRELLSSIRDNEAQIQDKLFFQVALNHIKTRPELFLIRTINRVRNYFAFDTFTGSALINSYSFNNFLGLAVIAIDALFYCAIMLLALRYMFTLQLNSNQFDYFALFMLLALGYAAPYWISFSHPTYHFPIIPLFGVLASALTARIIEAKHRQISWSWIPQSGRKKYSFLIICLVFIFTQIEWVLVMWSRI